LPIPFIFQAWMIRCRVSGVNIQQRLRTKTPRQVSHTAIFVLHIYKIQDFSLRSKLKWETAMAIAYPSLRFGMTKQVGSW